MTEHQETEHAVYESLHLESPLPVAETDNFFEEIPEENTEKAAENGEEEEEVHIKAPHSILIVGATGLVGLRMIKYLQNIAPAEQSIYILARRHLFRERPGVKVIITEAPNWPAEIAKIPNLTTVYSGINARPQTMYHDPQAYPGPDEFYLVNHNLNYQVALAAKAAGASTFVLISHFGVSYPFFRILDRKTKMRKAIETDLEAMNFERLMIFRPGPLVGVREKTGTLKGFSFTSIMYSCFYMALEPMFVVNYVYPLATVNFATSVAKAAAVYESAEPTGRVEKYNGWHIMYGAYKYNISSYSSIFDQATEPFDHFKVEKGTDLCEQTEISAICDELKFNDEGVDN